MLNKTFITLYLLLIITPAFPTITQHIKLSTGLDINLNFPTRMLVSGLYELEFGSGDSVQAGLMVKPGSSLLSSWHLQYNSRDILLEGLTMHLKAMNQRYHTYLKAENSLMLWAGYTWKRIEVNAGVNARFLNLNPDLQSLAFYYPLDLLQWHWLWRVAYLYEWQSIPLSTGFEVRNFGDFYADNSFVLAYHLINILRINDKQSWTVDAGLHPSGFTGMSTLYNKFTLDVSVEFSL